MKTRIVELCIFLLKVMLRGSYFFIKLLPVKDNKVVFCSRQMDDIPLDYQLIQQKLKQKDQNIICVNVCQRVGNDLKGYIRYIKALFTSMVHLATSRVCIIDSYWPAVSLLHHKKELTVIQIWHAIGKIKKSGYASVGKKSGRNITYARKLHMHENYDYVVAGGEAWNPFYCESFGVSEKKLLNYGLPRIDYLIETEAENRERFLMQHPELCTKKKVLYVPTFRRNMENRWEEIVQLAENDDIVLIIKNHPGEKPKECIYKENILKCDDWKTMDLLAAADYVVTDYSAIALEAAVIGKKTFFWTYDYDEYVENNGLNLDLYGTVPMHIFEELDELALYIEEDRFDQNAFEDFRRKYLPEELGTSTEKIVSVVLKSM